MVWLVVVGVVIMLVWAMSANVRRRRAEENLRLIAAYGAGRLDALEREPPAMAPVTRDESKLAFPRGRVAPTSESRRLGYWRQPPCEISNEGVIGERLSGLAGAPPEICFTGFVQADEDHLKRVAEESGFRVRTSVTKHLTFLCAGEGPGPTKLGTAHVQGCPVISAEQFSRLAFEGWDPV